MKSKSRKKSIKKSRKSPIGKSLTKLAATMDQPIPVDTFNFALTLYEQAARGTMPGYHLKGGPGPDDEPGGIYLTNIPINRGMMAVVRETRHLTEEVRQSLLMRLMHFGEMMAMAQADARFADHFKPSDEEGVLMISGAFTHAAAECRFVVSAKNIGPDMDDLYRLAELYRDED